jgi:hypothetical protein
VLELQAGRSDIVGCYARLESLDRISNGPGLALRVAADELLLLGARSSIPELEEELLELDSDGLVIDLSSAYSVWSLRGEERVEAFCRLSQIELPKPTAFVQGLVADVPAKVVVREEELLLVVSSAVTHHLRERVLGACVDLDVSERCEKEALEETAVA